MGQRSRSIEARSRKIEHREELEHREEDRPEPAVLGPRPVEASSPGRDRGGELPPLAELYEAHARFVHGLLLSELPHEDAEDLTHEVFLRFWRSAKSVREPERVASYLARIARNLVIDRARREARQPRRVSLEEAPGSVLVAEAEEEGLREQVLACIRSLAVAYRETLVLRLIEGLSAREIAEWTGMTEGSVRVNLCRGMGMLRERLARNEES